MRNRTSLSLAAILSVFLAAPASLAEETMDMTGERMMSENAMSADCNAKDGDMAEARTDCDVTMEDDMDGEEMMQDGTGNMSGQAMDGQ